MHNNPNRSRWEKDAIPNMELVVDYDVWMTDTGELAKRLGLDEYFQKDEEGSIGLRRAPHFMFFRLLRYVYLGILTK